LRAICRRYPQNIFASTLGDFPGVFGSYSDLLGPVATDDDEPCRSVRAKILQIAGAAHAGT